MAVGRIEASGEATVWGPEPVGDASTIVDRLRRRAEGAHVLVGFDFPIGLPGSYAKLAGVSAFPEFLRELGDRSNPDFFAVADSPGDISVDRPFYPTTAAGARHRHQLDGLGVAAMNDLRRACERPTEGRRAAAPLFWLVGAAQVGRAAISGWRDVLIPALRSGSRVAVWPFDGGLGALLDDCDVVVAETYPTEFYRHLHAHPGPGGKRKRTGREPASVALATAADALGSRLSEDARQALEGSFGDRPDGEDRFDAFVGLLGMLNVVIGPREPGPPASVPADVVAVEGWILGQGRSVRPGT